MLDFVVGHEKLLNLFKAALFARTSAKKKRFGSVDMALHCERAKNALDNVLKQFEKFGWQRPPAYSSSWSSIGAAPWKIIAIDGATLYSPTGQSFTEEPAAIREEYEKVPMAPQKKKFQHLALDKKEQAKGDASTDADRHGTYEILAEAQVRAALSIASAPVSRVLPGVLVTVLDVVTWQEEGTERTRALIENPVGWITLLNVSSGKRFAQRQKDPQHIDVLGAHDVKSRSSECDIDEGVSEMPAMSTSGLPQASPLVTRGRLSAKRVSFAEASAPVDLESGLDFGSGVHPTTYGAVADLDNGIGVTKCGRANCTSVPQPLQQELSFEQPTGFEPFQINSCSKAHL